MWVQFERHLHARNLWLGLHPWRWLVARMKMMTMCCCASEINVMASLALFHSLVKSVTPWGLKESLPCVDILTENFSHVRVKKNKRLYLFQILRGKNAYESDVLVFSLPFSIDSTLNQFFCLLENICVLSEATESESNTEQSKLQANISLFHAVKCLINPYKHELC